MAINWVADPRDDGAGRFDPVLACEKSLCDKESKRVNNNRQINAKSVWPIDQGCRLLATFCDPLL